MGYVTTTMLSWRHCASAATALPPLPPRCKCQQATNAASTTLALLHCHHCCHYQCCFTSAGATKLPQLLRH